MKPCTLSFAVVVALVGLVPELRLLAADAPIAEGNIPFYVRP
jgi:hypothetical protein